MDTGPKELEPPVFPYRPEGDCPGELIPCPPPPTTTAYSPGEVDTGKAACLFGDGTSGWFERRPPAPPPPPT